jgi:hypothetical protein
LSAKAGSSFHAMSGPLKNARHERFAQELAKGVAAVTAYEAAGYKPDRGAASRLSAKINIQARVDELKERAARKAEITVADIARQLDEDREFAKGCGSAAAMVSATLGKAKVLGLIKERHEHGGVNGGPIEYRNLGEEEIDARLAALNEQHGHRPLAH